MPETTTRRVLGRAFPVGEYIVDECEARGWTRLDLAERMGGDVDVNDCELALLIGVPNSNAYLGEETARQLAHAFGTSPDFWLNLDRAWRDHVR